MADRPVSAATNHRRADLTALDLEAGDAGAVDGDDEIDLVLLVVVGDALAGDEEVVVKELVA